MTMAIITVPPFTASELYSFKWQPAIKLNRSPSHKKKTIRKSRSVGMQLHVEQVVDIVSKKTNRLAKPVLTNRSLEFCDWHQQKPSLRRCTVR